MGDAVGAIRLLRGVAARLLAVLLVPLLAFVLAPPAHADPAADTAADTVDEAALAARFAPVVRLVRQPEECGPGAAYEPTDVDVLFDEPTVALRGPWNPTDLVKIGPRATDLVNRYEYHLDFPGNPLNPGCGYEQWARRLTAGSSPTMYAHVVGDSGHPGQLALQYWLFYPFNDFNNLHEGDWEMVQIIFQARNAREALQKDPVAVGYSAHEGAERADWGDDKLEIVDGTHPVVYPAVGSQANKYTAALYLGASAEGVGCDDTRGPHNAVRPVVKTIPSDPAAARAEFPWIAFEGRWGELRPAFFNGPTGPNLKTQWTEPIQWSQGWRPRSYAVPSGGVLGTRATDFFCGAVATASKGLVRFLRNLVPTLIALAAVIAIAVFAGTRTTWRPSTPLRLARRRTWGQILTASGRMYRTRARVFLAIGLLFLPLGLIVAGLEAVLLGGFGLVGVDTTGESAGALAFVVIATGVTVVLFGVVLVQAATTCALVEIDEGRPVGAIRAYRLALLRLRPLLAGLAVMTVVCLALTVTWDLIPVAVWLGVSWMLFAQAVMVENCTGIGGLRRSRELVRGRWLRVASVVGLGAVLALVAGPLLGAVLILLTDAPLALLNIVAGVVYALAMPFVALTATYVYVDARVRAELQPREMTPELTELPAQVQLYRR